MTTDLDPETIRTRLDLPHIVKAAANAAWRLNHGGEVAGVRLEPGDATCYPILVVRAEWWTDFPHPVWTPGGSYIVCLVGPAGSAYPWHGEPMHARYCAEKWAAGGNLWTGVVVAEFLTELAGRLLDAP